jgi:RNA polymerase sigma-70 factor (ECF subfamily)
MERPGPQVEIAARGAWERKDYPTAATMVIEAYGAELYSFLLARFTRGSGQADDVFADFAEDFWRSLPTFAWRCSARAWCYKLARSAASRHRRSPHERVDRRMPLSAARSVEEVVLRARTSTHPYLRTDVKDQVQKLRDKLTPEERDLLILRIDRDLSWRDVAYAMLSPDEAADDEHVRKLEASLRQRFVDVKKRLKRLAEEAGLV